MKYLAGALLALGLLAACSSDLTTAPARDRLSVAGQDAQNATAACPTCVFGPKVYTRSTAKPVTESNTFAGDAAAQYVIDISDGGTQGADGSVTLNGVVFLAPRSDADIGPRHIHATVALLTQNVIDTRLTGKPGSTLTVSIERLGVPLSALQLVFSQNFSGNLGVYSMTGDGSNLRYLNVGTHVTARQNLILARGGWGDNQIYAMDADGGNRHVILGAGPSYVPDLAPDGSRYVLMFGDCAGGAHPLGIAAVSGGLTVLPICTYIPPRWSPVGDRIAYGVGGALYSVKIDGSDVRTIAPSSMNVTGVAWSPDASKLVFAGRVGTATNDHLYVINADGTNLQPITNAAAESW